jgi:hypothetical protein
MHTLPRDPQEGCVPPICVPPGTSDRENGGMGRVRLVRGHGVQLVRWRAVENGWVADVRRGRRVAEDADGWAVLIGGRVQRFERPEWSEFVGELAPPGGRPARIASRTVPTPPEASPPSPAHPRSTALRDIPSTRPVMEPGPPRSADDHSEMP